MDYRCSCDTVEGFVQQLAVGYISRGYWFYVTGRVPEGKDPAAVDAKLLERYSIDVSKWQRARRKRAGTANLHYLRHGRFFVLLATHGTHGFFQDEQFRDIRETPDQIPRLQHRLRQGHRRALACFGSDSCRRVPPAQGVLFGLGRASVG